VTGIDAEIKELGDPSREDTFDEEQFDARTELKERFFLAIRSISDEMNFDMGAYERLSFFIDSIYMQSSKDRKDVDRVVLSTVHSAKGLEWDWVWVAGCCEGIFPFIPSADKIDVEGGAPSFDVFDDRGVTDDEMQIEEERRLMYVAVTRARRELSISWFSSMRAPGGVGIVPREKSRFVNEVQLSRPELRIQQSRDMLAQARGIVACVSEKNPYFVFSTTTLSDMEFHLANAEVSFDKKDHDALFASYEEIKDRLFELKMRTTPKIRVIAPPISVSTN
jgi:superfamily I DNA/RNA helicase